MKRKKTRTDVLPPREGVGNGYVCLTAYNKYNNTACMQQKKSL